MREIKDLGHPAALDLSPLLCERVDTVTFAQFVVFINVEPDTCLSIEGPMTHTAADGNYDECTRDEQIVTSRLMALTGRTVTEASIEGRGDLVLRFDDGQELVCSKRLDYYESYHVRARARITRSLAAKKERRVDLQSRELATHSASKWATDKIALTLPVP